MSCRRSDSCRVWYSLPLFFLLLVPTLSLNLDGTLLLSLKYSILNDPSSVLDNWDYNDRTPCFWTGVTCSNMFRVTSLVLPNSNLFGSIPEDLGLIQHLQNLDLSNNFFNGTLPKSLFNASELQVLSLSNNAISGELPEIRDGLSHLRLLNLSNNALAGKIPEKLTSLENLAVVSLRSNYFSGTIPDGFGFVEVLDLSSNLFNGTLPVEFGGGNLRYLNLSSNKFSGVVSPDFAKRIPPNATIDLSFNNLTGELPESIALSNQKQESYAGNIELCGKPLKKLCSVPSTLSAPPHESINTSTPAIAAIPKTFQGTPDQNSPGSTTNGDQNQQQHGLKPGTIAGITVGDLAGIGVLALIVLYVYQLRKKKANAAAKETTTDKEQHKYNKSSEPSSIVEVKEPRNAPTWSCLSIRNGEETSEATGSETDENNNHGHDDDQVKYDKEKHENSKNERSLVMVDGETQMEIDTLFKASAYILGSSGASIVYKAVLQDGSAFAVRRIGESGIDRFKDFENQVKAIAKLRHQNLVRVRGFYWGDDEKLVICDYIDNGSLENAGYRKMGSSPYNLPFEVRLKVARGVARGLSYIHEKKHVHGNIKPSSILLTRDMEPVISDFGLQWLVYGKKIRKSEGPARHFGSKRSTSSSAYDGLQLQDHHHHHSVNGSPNCIGPAGFVGCTSPYHAPESLQNLKPNSKWDVYSFGILLLELLTGKVVSDRELSQWTTGAVVEDKNRILRMTEEAIRGEVASREDATLACFKLGFSCASLTAQKRPSMKDALQVLEKIPTSSSFSY